MRNKALQRVSVENIEKLLISVIPIKSDEDINTETKINSNKVDLYNKMIYNYYELTFYNGSEFIINAYKALLKRIPDKSGYKEFYSKLIIGSMSKNEILTTIKYSKEGIQKKVVLKNSKIMRAYYIIYKIPIISGMIRWTLNIIRLNSRLKKIQEVQINEICRNIDFDSEVLK